MVAVSPDSSCLRRVILAWSYTESTGTTCFVAFRRNANGATMLVLTETNGLSPEQYLLADYYNEVYWA